jgi:hypothetical protein
VPQAEFERRIAGGRCSTCPSLRGHYYGTPAEPSIEAMNAGLAILRSRSRDHPG